MAMLGGAPAARAALPASDTAQVRVSTVSGGFVLRLGSRASRQLAGRIVRLTCVRSGGPADGSAPASVGVRLRMPPSPTTIRIHSLSGGYDLCSIGPGRSVTAIVALGSRARGALADGSAGLRALAVVPLLASRHAPLPSAATVVRRSHRRAVALSSPGARPRRGRVGVYSDGRRGAVVVVSPTGRRLFLDATGPRLDANVLSAVAPLSLLGKSAAGVGLRVPAAAIAAPPPPASGVSATAGKGRVTVAFADSSGGSAAYGRVAGRRLVTRCLRDPDPEPLIGDGAAVTGTIRAPAARSQLVLAAPPAADLCLLGDRSGRVRLSVPVTARGATYLLEAPAGSQIAATLVAAQRLRSGGRWPSPTLLARATPGVTAVSGPSAPPPAGHVGVYGDGNRRLGVVEVAPDGRRLYYELDGAELRTDALALIAGLA